MTKLLAIETSSESCSLALSVDGQTSERVFHEPRRHAELLLPSIRELLAENDISLSELDAIAFGQGPGSFTSLRIGIGVVQGLAWGADLGVIPVSSLAALAQGVVSQHDIPEDTTVIVAMDARMDEVFHARYQVGSSGLVELIGQEQVSPPETVGFPEAGLFVCAGNGFERYVQLREGLASEVSVFANLWPTATNVLKLGTAWLLNHDALPAHQAQPHYVRDNVAKKSSEQ